MLWMIFIKLLIGFIGLWIITFVIGRKQIVQTSPLDFFTALLLSEMVGNTLYDDKVNVGQLVFALIVWAILSYSIQKLSTRYYKISKLAQGRPCLIVENGNVNHELLRSLKLDFRQIATMLREKDIFHYNEVLHVVYETNGSISVIKKPEYEFVRHKDLNLKTDPENIGIPVIDDGEIMVEDMRGRKINAQKIRELAAKQGYANIKDISYAEYEEGDELLIIPRDHRR